MVFGVAWRVSGVYVQILSVMFLLQFIVVPMSQTLNILERQDLQLLWDIIRLISVMGFILLGKSMRLTHYYVVGIYSLGMAFSYVILFILIYITLKLNPKERRKL